MQAVEKRETDGSEGVLRETAKGAVMEQTGTATLPDPEVEAKPTRRIYSAKYKLQILKQADACTDPGSLGGLLRREGLYASNLTTWRRQRDEGMLAGLTPRKRGRKEADSNPLKEENERLRRENERLAERLQRAELIIDVQKKVSQMLGVSLKADGE